MNPLFLGPIAELLKSVIGKIWPDPAQQADAQLKLAQLMQTGELAQLAAGTQLALAQIGVDDTEAASASMFKSGWRPAIGWVCGSAFAWNFVIAPAATWGMNAAAALGYLSHVVTLATADMSQMMPVLLGMLGLAGMRTAEKMKGAE
jgi:hypothetical protein